MYFGSTLVEKPFLCSSSNGHYTEKCFLKQSRLLWCVVVCDLETTKFLVNEEEAKAHWGAIAPRAKKGGKKKMKGKEIPDRPWGFQEVESPRFRENWHMKLTRLSALCIARLYPQEIFLRLSRLRGHSAAGMIMSMKYSNDTTVNRTRDLPACSAVPQPTVLLRAP